MFCSQLVFLAVILTLPVTSVDGQLKLRIPMCLASVSGQEELTLKALDLMMTFQNLVVSDFSL